VLDHHPLVIDHVVAVLHRIGVEAIGELHLTVAVDPFVMEALAFAVPLFWACADAQASSVAAAKMDTNLRMDSPLPQYSRGHRAA
jgi:hypothetical protein